MRIKYKTGIVFCFVVVCNILFLKAQAPYGSAGAFTPVELGSTESPFGYFEYLPLDYDESSSTLYPLVLFYHGSSQQGNGTTELGNVLGNGPVELFQQHPDFNAIVISPQISWGIFSASDFLGLYDYLTANYPIDINRIYVTGLSYGGGGTWNALNEHYDKIAAAVPICGAGYINNPSEYMQQTPIWAHHNFDDSVVDRENTITNVNSIANVSSSVMLEYPIQDNGTAPDNEYSMMFDTNSQTWSTDIGINAPTDKLAFTLYKDGGHNAWTRVYNNPDVWDWVFAQSINTLDVDEDTLGFKLFPNPTSDNITISTKNDAEKTIELYNVLGHKVLSRTFFRSLTLDVSSYASGIYFAKVIGDYNNNKVIKIIVN